MLGLVLNGISKNCLSQPTKKLRLWTISEISAASALRCLIHKIILDILDFEKADKKICWLPERKPTYEIETQLIAFLSFACNKLLAFNTQIQILTRFFVKTLAFSCVENSVFENSENNAGTEVILTVKVFNCLHHFTAR